MKKLFISFICFLTMAGVCFAETVVFNTKTHKIHKPTCKSAVMCTKNCVKIDRAAAVKRGGKSCKTCGG